MGNRSAKLCCGDFVEVKAPDEILQRWTPREHRTIYRSCRKCSNFVGEDFGSLGEH